MGEKSKRGKRANGARTLEAIMLETNCHPGQNCWGQKDVGSKKFVGVKKVGAKIFGVKWYWKLISQGQNDPCIKKVLGSKEVVAKSPYQKGTGAKTPVQTQCQSIFHVMRAFFRSQSISPDLGLIVNLINNYFN